MFRVDLLSSTPSWRQIYDQLEAGLRSGVWPPGSAMPSVRSIAGETGLARGTVSRAFSELRDAGLVVLVPGRGPFAAR